MTQGTPLMAKERKLDTGFYRYDRNKDYHGSREPLYNDDRKVGRVSPNAPLGSIRRSIPTLICFYYCKIDPSLKNWQVIAKKRNTCQNIKKRDF